MASPGSRSDTSSASKSPKVPSSRGRRQRERRPLPTSQQQRVQRWRDRWRSWSGAASSPPASPPNRRSPQRATVSRHACRSGMRSGQVGGRTPADMMVLCRVPQVALGHVAGACPHRAFDELSPAEATSTALNHPASSSPDRAGRARCGHDGRGSVGVSPILVTTYPSRAAQSRCNGGAQQLRARNQVVSGERADDASSQSAHARHGGQSDHDLESR